MKYLGSYGLYLQREFVCFDVKNPRGISPEDVEDELLGQLCDMARELAQSWVGAQGFCEFDEEDYDEEERAEMEQEEIEGSLEYSVRPWREGDETYFCDFDEDFDIEQITV